MEADWSVALAADDPLIVVPWSASPKDKSQCRFVDLRRELHHIDEIEEAQRNPELRGALLRLNGAASPWWTAKCDVWSSSVEEGGEAFDPYEMDADPEETAFGSGSYIDLSSRDAEMFTSFEHHERWMRATVDKLRMLPVRAARVDLVLRHAEVESASGFAVSWFVEGCGHTVEGAEERWSEAFGPVLGIVLEGVSSSGSKEP